MQIVKHDQNPEGQHLVWLVGRGASIACRLGWTVPPEWSSLGREDKGGFFLPVSLGDAMRYLLSVVVAVGLIGCGDKSTDSKSELNMDLRTAPGVGGSWSYLGSIIIVENVAWRFLSYTESENGITVTGTYKMTWTSNIPIVAITIEYDIRFFDENDFQIAMVTTLPTGQAQ